MLEIVIERWIDFEGRTEFRWSLWRDGHRIEMGPRSHSDSDECEVEAMDFCHRALGGKPDKVTRL